MFSCTWWKEQFEAHIRQPNLVYHIKIFCILMKCQNVGKYKTWTPGPWTPSVDPGHGPGPSKYGPSPWTPFHGPGPWTPLSSTRSMDPLIMDRVHGPPIFTSWGCTINYDLMTFDEMLRDGSSFSKPCTSLIAHLPWKFMFNSSFSLSLVILKHTGWFWKCYI